MTQSPQLRILDDPNAVARAAAELIDEAARDAIAARGVFSLVLTGGSTPRILNGVLADPDGPYRNQIEWQKIEVYVGDERAVPPDHPDSNYRMNWDTLLSRVPIRPQNIQRMRGEIDAEEAAKEYGQMLKERFGEGGPDLTLLGMGEDGHTASLFPHTSALEEARHRCVGHFVEHSTTGPSWRITMTAPFLNRSEQVILLVTGAAKATALKQVLQGPRDPMRLPAQLIAPPSGRLNWLVDRAAAGELAR